MKLSDIRNSLSISCVIFNTEPQVFKATIDSLVLSCKKACTKGWLDYVELTLIDNTSASKNLLLLNSIKADYATDLNKIAIIAGHGNIGYGAAHNLALLKTDCTFHLILNPDVILTEDNISLAVEYMLNHPDAGLIAPDAFYQDGGRQYIAKRKPDILILVARAIRIGWLNKMLGSALARYEYRDKIPASTPFEIELASGCYMLVRAATAKAIKGFDENYFMYFEDFDFSQRISSITSVKHHPSLKIVHHGGNSSRKGLLHIIYFARSFLRYKYKSISRKKND